jgi:hypothetical protein
MDRIYRAAVSGGLLHEFDEEPEFPDGPVPVMVDVTACSVSCRSEPSEPRPEIAHPKVVPRTKDKREQRSNDEIVAHHGPDFVMFESCEDARDFDHEELAEARSLNAFLDALHTPKRSKDPLSLVQLPRTKAGNRVNPVTLEWDRVDAGHTIHRWRKWIHIRRREAQDQILGFRNALVLATIFALFLCCGMRLQRSVRTRNELPPPLSINVASTATPGKHSPQLAPPLIERDEFGTLVEVRASDPRSVLLGFCQGMTSEMCEPMELAWSDPPHPQIRIGLFRSFYDIRAIEIRRDPRTHQWRAGDGSLRVDDFLAHSRRMSSNRIPVELAWSRGRNSD